MPNTLYISNQEHTKYLWDCIKAKPNRIIITTFGIYAGITWNGSDTTTWGSKYRMDTRELLEAVRNIPQVDIIVGLSEYRSCKDKIPCRDCEKQFIKQLFRLLGHAECFPTFKWHMGSNIHTKYCLFFYDKKAPRGLAGGRNFTDSDWADISFPLSVQHINKLDTYTTTLLKNTTTITSEAIEAILENSNIPVSSVNSLVEEA
ncbi:MAG: hypothetical protein H7831_06650 [Magnetococcus sp. WYHC-3]